MRDRRVRTQSRFDGLYGMAVECHRAGKAPSQAERAFHIWTVENADLSGQKSIQTAKAEFQAMADLRLAGRLPLIRSLTQQRMEKEPPGTRLRFNHEFVKLCRFLAEFNGSVEDALGQWMSHHL